LALNNLKVANIVINNYVGRGERVAVRHVMTYGESVAVRHVLTHGESVAVRHVLTYGESVAVRGGATHIGPTTPHNGPIFCIFSRILRILQDVQAVLTPG
jgi:hypothetical protein